MEDDDIETLFEIVDIGLYDLPIFPATFDEPIPTFINADAKLPLETLNGFGGVYIFTGISTFQMPDSLSLSLCLMASEPHI